MSSEKLHRCLLIDPDEADRRSLQAQLATLTGLQLVGAVANPALATPILESVKVDLLFIEITAPAYDGLEFLNQALNVPQMIVVSRSPDHAIQAYELGVTDYILKPFTRDRLDKAIKRATSRLSTDNTPAVPNYVVLKSGWESVRIPVDSINYIEAFGAFCKVHTTTGITVVSDFLSTVYAKLPPKLFLRIHKSFVVASWKVNHMASRHVQVGETNVPVGASYRHNVEQVLLAH